MCCPWLICSYFPRAHDGSSFENARSLHRALGNAHWRLQPVYVRGWRIPVSRPPPRTPHLFSLLADDSCPPKMRTWLRNLFCTQLQGGINKKKCQDQPRRVNDDGQISEGRLSSSWRPRGAERIYSNVKCLPFISCNFVVRWCSLDNL